jgi:hypothetical protein
MNTGESVSEIATDSATGTTASAASIATARRPAASRHTTATAEAHNSSAAAPCHPSVPYSMPSRPTNASSTVKRSQVEVTQVGA